MSQAAIVSAFIRDGAGGNAAGVVLDASGFSDTERQKIAARLGLSETVFVEPLSDGAIKLRFFTPTVELDLCGHATIAAFAHLLDKKRIACGRLMMDAKAGALAVEVLPDGLVWMDQNTPVFGASVAVDAVTAALGGAKILDARVVSTGLPDLLAEVASREVLWALKPDLAAVRDLTAGSGALSLHVYAKGAGGVAAYCRDFAPLVGIDEDPATGTASGALACHLVERGAAPVVMTFIQGPSLDKTSEILALVQAAGRRIDRVRVGGRAKLEREVPL